MVPVIETQRIPPEDTPIAALVRPFQKFAGRETSGLLPFARQRKAYEAQWLSTSTRWCVRARRTATR